MEKRKFVTWTIDGPDQADIGAPMRVETSSPEQAAIMAELREWAERSEHSNCAASRRTVVDMQTGDVLHIDVSIRHVVDLNGVERRTTNSALRGPTITDSFPWRARRQVS